MTTDNTTFDKKVYAGMPFRYKITRARYWDKTVAKSVTANTVDDVALEPYDGVTITQDGTVLSVSAGILPDGGAYRGARGGGGKYSGYRGVAAPAGKRYFLCNANTVYDNFSRRGSPDIGEDGVLRNITSGNNIYTAFYNQSYPWEITVKIHTPETFADQSYIFGNYSTNRATPQLCTDAAGGPLPVFAGCDYAGAPYAVSGEFDFGLGYCGRGRFRTGAGSGYGLCHQGRLGRGGLYGYGERGGIYPRCFGGRAVFHDCGAIVFRL